MNQKKLWLIVGLAAIVIIATFYMNSNVALSPGNSTIKESSNGTKVTGGNLKLPDLVVLDLYVNGTRFSRTINMSNGSGQKVDLYWATPHAVVKNIGQASSGASHTRIQVRDSITGQIVSVEVNTGALAVGQQRIVSFPYEFEIAKGDNHTINGWADIFKVVRESNENNNERQEVFTV